VLARRLGPSDLAHFVPTIGDDVTAFREQFGVDWTQTAGKQAR
jgi:hypothetical protein